MKERPILFSGPMVRALLAGTKTQTRRVVKLKNGQYMPPCERADPNGWRGMLRLCPYGQPGDRLWVREAWRADVAQDKMPPRGCAPNWPLWFEADGEAVRLDRVAGPTPGKLRPGMFMPRWASRITLQITSVRVERLQEISEADAAAEGIERKDAAWWRNYISDSDADAYTHLKEARASFSSLWVSINGAGSWDSNPWVWVVEFKRVEQQR